jgi:hypothetical protein
MHFAAPMEEVRSAQKTRLCVENLKRRCSIGADDRIILQCILRK